MWSPETLEKGVLNQYQCLLADDLYNDVEKGNVAPLDKRLSAGSSASTADTLPSIGLAEEDEASDENAEEETLTAKVRGEGHKQDMQPKSKKFVPVLGGIVCVSMVFLIGLVGLARASVSARSNAIYMIVLLILVALWMRAFGAVAWWLLTQEHPESTAAIMREDARLPDMPSTGGEGKSAVVIGGGISGLATARYLLRAGFSQVVLLEGREKLGGNNEPFVDGKDEHATTCVFTSPSQQPHYADLCRELHVEQTPHELETVDGAVVLNGRSIAVHMGGENEVYNFLRRVVFQADWGSLIDGVVIFCLLFYVYQLRPECGMSIAELLGPRLANTSVFRDFYMGWVGVNVWCRFNDLDEFPAHSFATFIFEYACPLEPRDCDSTPGCCVLDGRLLQALESANCKYGSLYEQHTNVEVIKVRKATVSGKKQVIARHCPLRAQVLGETKAKQLDTLGYDMACYWGEVPWDVSPPSNDHLVVFECDVVVLATQPGPARTILSASTRAQTEAEDKEPFESPSIPPAMLAELSKWSSMECFTFVHCDGALANGRAWVHETLKNAATGQHYQHYAIHPRVGDKGAKYWISYVYGREHAKDFVAHHLATDKIVEVLTPTLPMFTGENTVFRNQTWRRIDAECVDVWWTACCRSGLQFHNNGILSAKRVVLSIVGEGW